MRAERLPLIPRSTKNTSEIEMINLKWLIWLCGQNPLVPALKFDLLNITVLVNVYTEF